MGGDLDGNPHFALLSAPSGDLGWFNKINEGDVTLLFFLFLFCFCFTPSQHQGHLQAENIRL